MHRKPSATSYFIFLYVTVMGCSHDQGFQPVYQVPGEFQETIQDFINEADARGYDINITNLIIRLDDKMELPKCGACNSLSQNRNVQKIITINASFCWVNDQEMEALIFHELGHCILGREHTTDLLPNGDPKSLMTPHEIDHYTPCIYQIGNEDCDKTFKRDYYVAELFDETTPVPVWGN